MANNDKISYPNPQSIDDDTLGEWLKGAFKKLTAHDVHLIYEIENDIANIYIIDRHYYDFIHIVVQPRTISLQLTAESTKNFDQKAVNEIFTAVQNLFYIRFTLKP
jgi:predicted transport protein